MANSSLLASSWLVLHLTWKAKSWHNWQTIQWLGICAERERKWKNYDSIPFDLWTCDSVHVDEPFQDNGHQQDILRTLAFNLPIVLSECCIFFSLSCVDRTKEQKGRVLWNAVNKKKVILNKPICICIVFLITKSRWIRLLELIFLRKKRYTTVVTLWWNSVDRISVECKNEDSEPLYTSLNLRKMNSTQIQFMVIVSNGNEPCAYSLKSKYWNVNFHLKNGEKCLAFSSKTTKRFK